MLRSFLVAIPLFCSFSFAAGADRPNILFCFSDDWGRYASIYRDPETPGLNDVISTPALDAIGQNGVVFNNAFVSAPSCRRSWQRPPITRACASSSATSP